LKVERKERERITTEGTEIGMRRARRVGRRKEIEARGFKVKG
jgi:hypothetical protein